MSETIFFIHFQFCLLPPHSHYTQAIFTRLCTIFDKNITYKYSTFTKKKMDCMLRFSGKNLLFSNGNLREWQCYLRKTQLGLSKARVRHKYSLRAAFARGGCNPWQVWRPGILTPWRTWRKPRGPLAATLLYARSQIKRLSAPHLLRAKHCT
jgi:hypothetical protein